MKTIAFVPIKLNSERLPNKNILSFTNGKPLTYYIFNTLNQVKNIDEIYVYCSSEEIMEYIPFNIKFLKRDPYFDLPTTKFNDVLISFAQQVNSDIYALTHTTAPFIKAESISFGIEQVASKEYDSALAVTKVQEFLWKNNKPFNYDILNIPRTQDLEPLYAETCGLFVYTRDLIINRKRRIGDHPYLIEVSKIEACDVNDKDDFMIANAIYNISKKED